MNATTHWHSRRTGLRPDWATMELMHVSRAHAFAQASMNLANAFPPGPGEDPAPGDRAAQIAAVRWGDAERIDITAHDWRIEAWPCGLKEHGEPPPSAGDPAKHEADSEAAHGEYLKARAKRDWWFARLHTGSEGAQLAAEGGYDSGHRAMWQHLLWD